MDGGSHSGTWETCSNVCSNYESCSMFEVNGCSGPTNCRGSCYLFSGSKEDAYNGKCDTSGSLKTFAKIGPQRSIRQTTRAPLLSHKSQASRSSANRFENATLDDHEGHDRDDEDGLDGLKIDRNRTKAVVTSFASKTVTALAPLLALLMCF